MIDSTASSPATLRRAPLMIAAAVLALFANAALAQQPPADQKAQLCAEKRAGLDRLEAEARQTREQIKSEQDKLERFKKAVLNPSPEHLDLLISVFIEKIESLKRLLAEAKTPEERAALDAALKRQRRFLDLYTSLKIRIEMGRPITINDLPGEDQAEIKTHEDRIASLKERQTEVGRQIFLLRESLESLGCVEKVKETSGGGGDLGGLASSTPLDVTVAPRVE